MSPIHSLHRRQLLKTGGMAVLAANWPAESLSASPDLGDLQPGREIKQPVRIRSLELWQYEKRFLLRALSEEGVAGTALLNERVEYLYPILLHRIIPYFLGKDARELPALLDGAQLTQSNYKLVGIPFWVCLGYVEFTLIDLLGRIAGKPAGELLGGVLRRQIPVYLSSLRRDTTPEQEMEWLSRRVETTSSRALKLKIGGRMSQNQDAAPGRTEKLVELARKRMGDRFTIYVDANGSYDAAKAIEVGRMLESQGVAFYEEPCPFEEYEQTREVTAALKIPVAGGEQDTSWPQWRRMVSQRIVDIAQPDVNYNGGLLRTLRVARLAAAAGLPITPHCPQTGPYQTPNLHFASVVPNLGPFQEYNAAPSAPIPWCTPSLDVQGGMVTVPTGPGLGIEFDPSIWPKAQRL